MAATLPPSQTLYVNNLNDRVKKTELRESLYLLFAAYGRILDIVALKTPKMRGQAHIVFESQSSASSALKDLQGFNFYKKPMNVQYAKGRSFVLLPPELRVPSTKRTDADDKDMGGVSRPPAGGEEEEEENESSESEPESKVTEEEEAKAEKEAATASKRGKRSPRQRTASPEHVEEDAPAKTRKKQRSK